MADVEADTKTGEDRMASFVGRVISERYRIDKPIASGGMGAVFRGEHLHLRKQLAIKVLHSENEDLPGLVAQFEREAIAGAHIEHPNVAVATDFGKLEDGSYFLVLEYVDGVTLSDVIKKGPLKVERAVEIAKQIASALHSMHGIGIVHRDIKPQNIMLVRGEDGQAKLIDFGFAKVPLEQIASESGTTVGGLDSAIADTDTVFGTIGYLAPEAAEGMSAVDGRSDLYALGCILYEMLAGKKPFEGGSAPELFKQHRVAPVPSFAERAPGVPIPSALEAVVMRMLEKSPPKRYPTGRSVIIALEQAMPRMRSLHPGPEIKIEVAPPGIRWGRYLAMVIFLGVIGGIWWYALRSRGFFEESAEAGRKTEIDGLGASAWTARLLAAPAKKDWQAGSKAIAALAELEPGALKVEEVAQAAAAVAAGAVAAPDVDADEVLKLLAWSFGSDGLDVLYTVADQNPGEVYKKAWGYLRHSKSLDEASPALRITVKVRDAPCEFKHDLFAQAGKEGDARTLAALKKIAELPCRAPDDGCCFEKDEELKRAMAALGAARPATSAD